MKAILATALLLSAAATASAAPTIAVSAREARLWIRHLIPLPKQIAIPRALEFSTDTVAIRLREGATDVEAHAAQRLVDLLKTKVQTPTRVGQFQVFLGVCDREGRIGDLQVPGAEKLAALPNSDQAYVITPVTGNRLVLAGLTERGVYYAALTLRQLLAAKLAGDTVTIPLARVVDWPDLAERGEWGGSASDDVEWMASHKMNLIEAHAALKVTPDGKGHAQIRPDLLERGRLNALKVVPIIMHLDQIADSGIYRYFPELKGKGPSAQHRTFSDEVAPCLSQPKFFDILADWMTSLAEQKGVSDICVWLSEEPLQCGCENCRKVGQYALEARSVVKAWRLAVQKNPAIKVRILLTQGSYRTNDKVLAEVPPEVGVTYYDGGRTYDSSRDPMIYPLLEQYAGQGRWLGCYPQLTASWRIVCPWSGPQFIKYRMTEFVDKKLSCLCGYATPSNRLYDFNVAAAAEWAWNARGRSEREFCAAWATARGLKDPERAADWAMMLGPVGWDVYGSRVPYSAFFGEAGRMVRDRAKPVLGKGMYRYFTTQERFSDDLAACDKAMKLAEGLEAPALIGETQAIAGYVQMLQKLYAIAALTSQAALPTDAERTALNEDMHALSEAGAQVVTGLQAWEKACGQGLGGGRFEDTVNVTEQTVVDVGKALRPLGVRDPGAPYLRREVGTWQDSDFEQNESIRKSWDVTAAVIGPGTFHACFAYTRGWNALNISRAVLASAPKGEPGNLTELSVDTHHGLAGYEGKDNTYTFELPAHDENLSYFVLADINGVRSSDKVQERKGCNGSVTFWKMRRPGEKLPALPLLPMDPDEAARFSSRK